MSLIKDNDVPRSLRKHIEHILSAYKVDGSYHMIGSLEHSRFRRKDFAIHQLERDIEFYSHLVLLPLLGQATRRNDEDTLHDVAHQEFLQEQTSHNGLSRSRIIGKKKTNARLRKQKLIDRLYLMRQRIDNTTVDGKKWIKLIGRVDALSLSKENKLFGIS